MGGREKGLFSERGLELKEMKKSKEREEFRWKVVNTMDEYKIEILAL